jgi:hypothetical protein
VKAGGGHRRATDYLTWLAFTLAALAAAYVLHVHATVIALPAPQEYREPAIVLCTDLLARGGNPYALANHPVYTNIYGIGYHLVALPAAKLFGATFLVHRLLSGACAIAACVMIGAAARRAGAGPRLAFVAAVLLYYDLAVRIAPGTQRGLPLTILARPDALALLLFVLALVIPWWRDFSRGSLITAAVCAIAAFFVKAYFVLALPIVAGLRAAVPIPPARVNLRADVAGRAAGTAGGGDARHGVLSRGRRDRQPQRQRRADRVAPALANPRLRDDAAGDVDGCGRRNHRGGHRRHPRAADAAG